jgi:hypothetical protein
MFALRAVSKSEYNRYFRSFDMDKTVVAKAGEFVTDPNDGRIVCVVARDLIAGEKGPCLEDFTDWREEPPQVGDKISDFLWHFGPIEITHNYRPWIRMGDLHLERGWMSETDPPTA